MSSDSQFIDKSKEIFKIDKEIIDFDIDSSKIEDPSSPIALSETQISITNLTDNYLAFRTKTTKKTKYAVDPNSCIISPNEVKTLNIILYNVPGEKMETKGHKFLFEAIVINESEKEKNVKDLFVEYQNKANKSLGDIQKRNVKYNIGNKNEEKKKEDAGDSHLEQLTKEETKSKEQNTEKEIEKNDKEKINNKNEVKNNNMLQYLIIGVFFASLVIAFYLFKK